MLGIKSIQITPKILRQVAEIDEFKGLWRGLDRHTTALQLLGDVADYGANFKRMLGSLEEQPITIDVVQALNANQLGQKGKSPFKTKPNQLPISQNEKVYGTLDTAEPEQVAPLMGKLCEWVNAELDGGALHPLLVTAVFASVFLQVSPFETGNMRTMRFLVLLILMKAGYTYAPYASLAPIQEDNTAQFYAALKHNQDSLESGQPDWSQWLNCFLGMLETQKETLRVRLYEKEPELQKLPRLSARIMKLFTEHQRLQMKEIIKLTNGRRATIKLRLQELIDGGYLVRHGAGRSTWYALV